ncbi:MAG TPA: hypothetical protein VGC00_02200 [Thermoanaerobaculia bacterium]
MTQIQRNPSRSALGAAAVAALALGAWLPLGAVTLPAPDAAATTTVTLGPFEPFFFHGDLRDLPTVAGWQPGDPIKDVPDKRGGQVVLLPPANPPSWSEDSLRANQRRHDDDNAPTPTLTAPLHNFDGIDFQGVNPSDPVMDVGPRYVIAATNGNNDTILGGIFVVHDKLTGERVAGPTTLASLSPTCVAGFSDPIVMWDPIGERWMMAEISVAVNNVVCLYVSLTDDPVTGGWMGYAITTPVLPDYPKFGIWPDAYYMTTNENLADGSAIYALDRFAIENGLPLVVQRTTPAPAPLAGFGFQAFTPADLDGATTPPAGTPNFLVRHRDDEVHDPASNDPERDFLEIWEYEVDFLNPLNTTLRGPFVVAVAEFSSEICGLFAFECFPQPGTATTLDPLREVVMFRWVYRNFGSHETLVGNLVTDVDGSEHGGVRWIELRRAPGGAWALFQEGTWAPDAEHRWMGAIAMDGAGNVALSYSLSSTATYPAIRYTGRRAGDPPGVMTQGEQSVVESTSSNASNRWGDYANLVVDPEDDCTFWTTNNYVNPNRTWHTRVASFRFTGCNDLDFDGVLDGEDNCTEVANPSQCDSNGDGYGNACDADLDDNGIVDRLDRELLRRALGTTGESDADLDCDSDVDQRDMAILRDALGQPPGPSGLVSE